MKIDERYFPGGVEPPEQGVYYDVPYFEYAKWACFRKSMIHHTLRSAKSLYYDTHNNDSRTAVMDFGSLVDNLLLDKTDNFEMLPETYMLKNGTEKPFPRTGKKHDEYCNEIRARGRIPCNIEQVELARKIVDSIKQHPEAGAWLTGKSQVSLVWVDPETKVQCKARLDHLLADRLIDLKITDDPLPGAFCRIAERFRYHVQAAMYHDGWVLANGGEIRGNEWELPFSFIVAGASREMDVMCYNSTIDQLDAGREIYRRALELFAGYIEQDTVPGYSSCAEDLPIRQFCTNRVLLEGVIE